MKHILFTFTMVVLTISCNSQNHDFNKDLIREDLAKIILEIENNYVYLEDKNIDLTCIKSKYNEAINDLNSKQEALLLFEYLLDEFYDNHLTLMANVDASFRLYAPIYATFHDGVPMVSSVWLSQISPLKENIIGAQITAFNGIKIQEVIDAFPTLCQDKSDPEVKEWVLNKIISGRYNNPRILNLKLINGKEISFDIDKINFNENSSLLSVKLFDNIGYIRINNSLGNDDLVKAFDKAIDTLWNTNGVIIDLRNTIFGGDSYEARGIMSRFVTDPQPYQRHTFVAKSIGNPDVERNWIEYVSPRGEIYEKPVVILVGRWTGSMGEGLAIGFEGIKRGHIVGTEMRRLAGEVKNFGFINQKYGYKLSTAKLFHVNGVIREKYIPSTYTPQTTTERDEILDKGIATIKKHNH